MTFEKEVQRFKMQVLRKMPFYGDVLMHLVFVETTNVPTAATNGKIVWYNPKFMATLNEGQRNFVLMHEVFHVLLRHGIRYTGKKRDAQFWNVACDIIVNHMLLRLQWQFKYEDIPFAQPPVGVFANVDEGETAENLYAKIKADNKKVKNGKLTIRKGYRADTEMDKEFREIEIPIDVKEFEGTPEEQEALDQAIRSMISNAIKKARGTGEGYFIPSEIYALAESKKLDWRRLLKNFLSEEIGEDSSYTTPERKYLHMDLILPGHSLTEEKLETVWAFVDSSGSVGRAEMQQFLTQLYRISREFKCVFNICFWDTSVTDVYKNVCREEDVLKCVPHHSGGTDINCIYNWIHENRIKPDVMLILTDGYFGALATPHFDRRLGKKTFLVLSSKINENSDMKRIGKIARL